VLSVCVSVCVCVTQINLVAVAVAVAAKIRPRTTQWDSVMYQLDQSRVKSGLQQQQVLYVVAVG
jgi:hypothetical protein